MAAASCSRAGTPQRRTAGDEKTYSSMPARAVPGKRGGHSQPANSVRHAIRAALEVDRNFPVETLQAPVQLCPGAGDVGSRGGRRPLDGFKSRELGLTLGVRHCGAFNAELRERQLSGLRGLLGPIADTLSRLLRFFGRVLQPCQNTVERTELTNAAPRHDRSGGHCRGRSLS